MSADKRPTPEFGPNSAVMNAPHMTDEMREKIAQVDPRHLANWMPKPMKRLHLVVTLISIVVMVVSMLLKDREPTISMMLALGAFAILLINTAWYFTVLSHFRRKERA
jgi:hypothetical protein